MSKTKPWIKSFRFLATKVGHYKDVDSSYNNAIPINIPKDFVSNNKNDSKFSEMII